MNRNRQFSRKSKSLLDDIFLQPWFVGRNCAAGIHRLIPDMFFQKMLFYFEDWGCLVCRSKTRKYGSNGMCHICVTRIQKRLVLCLKRRALMPEPKITERDVIDDADRVRSARTLLKNLTQGEWPQRRLRLRTTKRVNRY
jgi:hypothetical protein